MTVSIDILSDMRSAFDLNVKMTCGVADSKQMQDRSWKNDKSKKTEWAQWHQAHETKCRPAVGSSTTGVASYEGGGLAHAAGWRHHTFLCMGARHWTGAGGDQEAFWVILATAAAKVTTARVTEAPPFETAHQALGNDLIKTLPMLLWNEDPGKHCVIRQQPATNKWNWDADAIYSMRPVLDLREISNRVKGKVIH